MNRSLVTREHIWQLADAVRHIAVGAVRIFAWDSLKSGFIDLRRLGRVPRVVALVGLVLVFGFIASILFNDPLRTSGALEPLPLSSSSIRGIFVPALVVPLTFISLILAWSLILTSALHLRRALRWGILICFLFFGLPPSYIGSLSGIAVENPLTLVWTLLHTLAAFALLFGAFIFLPRFKFSVAAEFAIVFGSLSGLFILMLYSAVQATRTGTVDFVNGYLVAEAITYPRYLTTPLIYLSGAEIIGFGIAFTGWGAQATARYARAWMITVLLVAFLLYRWFSVLPALVSNAASQQQWFAWGGAALAGVCLIPIAWWRVRQPFTDQVPFKLTFGIILLILVPPLLLFVSIITLGGLQLFQIIAIYLATSELDWNNLTVLKEAINIPYALVAAWSTWLYLILAGVGILVAVIGTRRKKFSTAAFGMILAWTQFVYWFTQTGRPLQAWRYQYADIEIFFLLALTALTLYWLARRALNADRALKLLALAFFTWVLHFTDFLDNPLAIFFGLAGISFTAFGILWSVLTAGGRWKVNDDSPSFPNVSRVLMAIGYVLLTLNISHWFLVTHNIEERSFNDDVTLTGLRVLGYTAAYLVIVEGGRALLKKET